ncbi:hypothetical protein [Limisalsivibrio acetivorans]|uniref:hypothetical protein n=1 Tax=Limisalsivibrio acetivorans TaxID=1304888 RepID=UPI0003B41446|nr:hypothetical protein [Limisalsivibrio acetivorans]
MKGLIIAVLSLIPLSVFASNAPAINGCTIEKLVTGEEAERQIIKLHRRDIDLKSAYVAHYECGEAKAILWTSFAEDKKTSRKLHEVMDGKMDQSRMFTNRREVSIAGKETVYVFGMGMDNYYFVHKDGNYWITTDKGEGSDITSRLIKELRD